jgi:hypothetical protein
MCHLYIERKGQILALLDIKKKSTEIQMAADKEKEIQILREEVAKMQESVIQVFALLINPKMA